MKLNEVKYYTPVWEPSRIKRLVKRLTNGELVRKNSWGNNFYYNIPDFKIAFDNLLGQFGQPASTGHIKRREGDMVYYMWIVSGWKVKLDSHGMKLEVWQAAHNF